jgi:hypothetical protein
MLTTHIIIITKKPALKKQSEFIKFKMKLLENEILQDEAVDYQQYSNDIADTWHNNDDHVAVPN